RRRRRGARRSHPPPLPAPVRERERCGDPGQPRVERSARRGRDRVGPRPPRPAHEPRPRRGAAVAPVSTSRRRAGCTMVALQLLRLAAAPRPVRAQRHDPAAHPRTGDALVLSTGASRGLAHAGALVALEYGGFDPALVVGASMGAVIGALYAAGYTAAEVRDVALRSDWVDLFTPAPREVGPARAPLFPGLTVGIETGPLEVSRGFIPDWRVNRFLTRALFDAGARARSDFDR